jgi:hypothetical protein
MGSAYLEFMHGEITLDGEPLPGILKSLRISGNVQFDDGDVDARSGKNRTNMGWEDADIVAVVELLSDENQNCYAKLALLNYVFQSMDENANPKIYTVLNSHFIGRRVSDVIFAGMSSWETDEDDVIEAELHFVEHEPYACQFEPGGATGTAAAVPLLDDLVLGAEAAA